MVSPEIQNQQVDALGFLIVPAHNRLRNQSKFLCKSYQYACCLTGPRQQYIHDTLQSVPADPQICVSLIHGIAWDCRVTFPTHPPIKLPQVTSWRKPHCPSPARWAPNGNLQRKGSAPARKPPVAIRLIGEILVGCSHARGIFDRNTPHSARIKPAKVTRPAYQSAFEGPAHEEPTPRLDQATGSCTSQRLAHTGHTKPTPFFPKCTSRLAEVFTTICSTTWPVN